MSLSKETLDAASPAAKTAAPAAPGKPDLSKLRADAVSLDVPVRVHGSRVKEVVRGVTPHTEPFEEEASTMIVLPHGGVVRMATTVGVGQMLVLTNLRTNQDAICRVVKVRAYSNSQAYVEVEFTHRQVGYWGVHFPADDDDSFPAADAPPPAASEPEKKPFVSSVTVKVETIPSRRPTAPARNESAFAAIGSHEDVQPPAAHTELNRSVIPSAPPVRVSASAPIAGATLSSVSKMTPAHPIAPMQTGPGASESNVELESSTPRTFGTLTGGTSRSAQSVSTDVGARLDEIIPAQSQAAAQRTNNWVWVAACLFFLVVGLAGGAFYFRQHSAGSQAAAQAPVALAQPVAPADVAPTTTEAPALQQENQSDTGIVPTPASAATIPEHPGPSAQSPSEQPLRSENATSRQLKPAPPAPSQPAKNFAPTDARPVARAIETRRMTAAPSLTTAPAVSASLSGSEALPGVLSPSEAAPPPPPVSQQPLTRVRVGGVIIQPKLLRSVPPNYPSAARSAGISGNVVIVAHLDKTGDVASMKVISGPPALQSAAMSALRGWKYRPATLDGVPIATDVTVTIRFQQQ